MSRDSWRGLSFHRGNRRAWWRVALLPVLLLISACDRNTTVPIVEVDPSTLGDGSGYPGEVWYYAPSPESLGWSRSRLEAASHQAQQMGSGAFMVVDRGIVVWEWGNASENWIVQSVRKSFLSGLYGIFVERGDIDLELTVAGLGIDDREPSLTDVEKEATVQQLLQARSGVYHEAAAESQSMKDARPPRWSHLPGTFWYYNNWDFNVLGTIFRQLTGEDIFESLYNRFAVPLQMQDFQVANGIYQYEESSDHPAYHFAMSARDMARYGLLFLRSGEWRGEQIIPEEWIAESTYPYSDTGNAVWDYGYMWWVGKSQAWGGHSLYAALGGSGHAIFVVPDMEVVVVHRVDYQTWRSDWSQVYQLLVRILAAKG